MGSIDDRIRSEPIYMAIKRGQYKIFNKQYHPDDYYSFMLSCGVPKEKADDIIKIYKRSVIGPLMDYICGDSDEKDKEKNKDKT